MAWTAPRTWSTGELVTAANMNTYIRDNQLQIRTDHLITRGIAAHYLGGDWTFRQTDASFTKIAGHTEVTIDGDDVGAMEAHFMGKVDAGTGQVRVYNVTDAAILGSAVNVTSTTDALQTITGLSPVSGAKNYRLEALKGTTWVTIWAARLVAA